MFLLSVGLLLNIIVWKQYLMGKIDICIQIGQFMTCSFIVLVPRKKKRRKQPGPGAPGRCVIKTWGFFVLASFDFEMIDFNCEFIFSL